MEFASALTRRPRLPVIDSSKLRVAVLDSASLFSGARVFPPERWSALEAFSPNVIAASSAQFKRLMDRMTLQTANAGALDHSVFVVTQLGDSPLTSRLRERIWRQFGVPVYEVYVDEEAHVLAFECEAQEGWHVQNGVRFSSACGELLLERGSHMVRTGLNWVTVESACECGREGLRLLTPDGLAAADALRAVNQ